MIEEDKVRRILAGLLIFIVSVIPVLALAGPALDTVKTNANVVLDVLGDPKLKGESGKKVKEQKVEAAADKLFDYVELSKRILGFNWNWTKQGARRTLQGIPQEHIDRITGYTFLPKRCDSRTPW